MSIKKRKRHKFEWVSIGLYTIGKYTPTVKCSHPNLISKQETCNMIGCCENNQLCLICDFGFGSSHHTNNCKTNK